MVRQYAIEIQTKNVKTLKHTTKWVDKDASPGLLI